MIDLGKWNILGILVDAVDYEAATERILEAARERRQFSASALAVHGIMSGVQDLSCRHRLNQLDMVAPDGQPVRWALRWLHQIRLPDRVYGPKLMLEVCAQASVEDLPIYLFGSRPEVLEELSRNLLARFPSLVIAGTQPSRFRRLEAQEQRATVAGIRASGARIVFVGLGCPRQEVWVYENRANLQMPLIAVGAAFDFHAGTLPQAPEWLQSAGLEWLFRLIREPKRLWRRYMLLNPQYLVLLGLQVAQLRNFDPHATVPPPGELRHG
jgi:exopolysaccharide biosynthesis WecB/TagA/CpsF family protein